MTVTQGLERCFGWRWVAALLFLCCALPPPTAAASMCFGVGDRYSWRLENGQYKDTPQLLSWLGFPSDNRLLAIWLPAGWQRSWFTGLQGSMDQGYIPVFFEYSLGDIYQQGEGAWHYVEAHQEQFYGSVTRLVQAIKPLHGTILVVLQPEFNVPGVQNRPAFGRMLAKAAEILHQAAHPGLRILVGTCVGDFGHYGATIDDQREWARFAPALLPAISKLNFLAFQEMRAGTHRDPQGIMRSFTPAQEGIDVLGQRAVAFSAYLQAEYHKPLLLAYFMVATLTPPDQAPGTWEKAAEKGYTGLFSAIPALARNGVFGVMAMSLFNDMAHNNDMRDYWGNASDHFGLVAAKAPLGQDHIGYPPYIVKPAGRVWIDGTRDDAVPACPRCVAQLRCERVRN